MKKINGITILLPWKGDMKTPQHENASTRKCLKKQNHKTNLMSSSLNLKLKMLYSNGHGRSARPPSLF